MRNVLFSAKFISQLESLDQKTQDLVIEKIDTFKRNHRDSSLRTHKLKGKLSGYLSFSINHTIRIVFEHGPKNTVHFLKIGDHGVYR